MRGFGVKTINSAHTGWITSRDESGVVNEQRGLKGNRAIWEVIPCHVLIIVAMYDNNATVQGEPLCHILQGVNTPVGCGYGLEVKNIRQPRMTVRVMFDSQLIIGGTDLGFLKYTGPSVAGNKYLSIERGLSENARHSVSRLPRCL